jgi:uncharacterized membrane protein HdeD (DUF308 family)
MRNEDHIVIDLKHAQHQILDYLRIHWRLFLFEGIFFILLGFCAIVIPQFFSVVIVIFLGWLIVIAGVIHISRSLFFSGLPGFGLWLGLGVLQFVVGYLLIADPIAGVLTLTMMMTLFFALEGVIKIYLALIMRPLPHWNLVIFSGLTALAFALIILAFWSETAHWLLGLFLGINMILLGLSMVKISLEHKTHTDTV